mgnify:CR=1 FL=1
MPYLSQDTAEKIITGDLDLIEIVCDNVEMSIDEMQIINEMFDEAAAEYALHPEHDFVEICNHVFEWIQHNYSVDRGLLH